MPKIKVRTRNEKNYMSFIYSYREKNQLKHIEKGIGYTMPPPKELEILKDQFFNKVFEKRWEKILYSIKSKYQQYITNISKYLLVQEYKSFGIKFTYESNKIEGSTITYKDTVFLLEHQMSPRNKKIADVIETKKHMDVYELLLKTKEDISLKLIKKWHRILFNETQKEHAGKFRNNILSTKGTIGMNVRIIGSLHHPPSFEKVVPLMKELILWYHEKKKIYSAVLLAGLFHLQIATIHPFKDGNGRISRLMMNYILHKNGYPMMNIRYSQRRGYYNSLENSQIKDKNEMRFINWYMRKFITENKKINF